MSRRLLTLLCIVGLAGAGVPAAEAGQSGERPLGAGWGVDSSRQVDSGHLAVGQPDESTGGGGDPTTSLSQGSAASESAAAPSRWTIRGSGFGHGVGMSQYGAYAMAEAGRNTRQILAHYYSDTTYEAVKDRAVIAVNLRHRDGTVAVRTQTLSGSSGGVFTITLGGKVLRGDGDTATFTRSGSSVAVSCSGCSGATSAAGATARVTFDEGDHLLLVDGSGYDHGDLSLTPSTGTSSGLEAVLRVRLHGEYLDHIAEMPWSWPAAALRAQAAAARAVALRKRAQGIKSSCACHLYDTTADQVFGPYPSAANRSYWSRWKKAVRATGSRETGYVPRYGGMTIDALYSSSNGGWSASNSEVWGTSQVPYLQTVRDDWSLSGLNPRAVWRAKVGQSSLASAFGLDDVVRLDLSDRTASWAVGTARATSSNGTSKTITGQQLVARLGLSAAWVRHNRERLGGSNRYAVAASVARRVQQSASRAVIASGDPARLIGAVVGGPLARAVRGPLLLTKQGELPWATRAELDRRAGQLTKVFVVGGSGTVGGAVVRALERRGLDVVRLSGASRPRTAGRVANRIDANRGVSRAVLVGANALPLAASATGPAAQLGQPILLTSSTSLSSAARTTMQRLGVSHVTIVGNTSAVSASVARQVRSLGISTNRVAGSNRYTTAAAVADHYRTRIPDGKVYLASGADPALSDALAAGSRGRLIVLTRPKELPPSALRSLQSTPGIVKVIAVGRTTRVSSSALWRAALS
jgi:stage II sporulation protein D